MLIPSTRHDFQTLLDALVLCSDDDTRPAITYLETGQQPIEISRRTFRTSVARYAAALHHLGIQPGQLVIIAHTQNLESIFAFWGALIMGAIPSMFPTLTEKLDPDVYMQNMGELVRLSAVSAVLTSDNFAPQLRPHITCPVYSTQQLSAQASDFTSQPPPPESTAFLQHSSGTTGLQKGVALSHRAVLNQIASYSEAIELRPDDVVVSWLPLYHDMGLIAGFLLPLIQGLHLVLMSPFDWVGHPALLFRAIHDYQGTLCWLPNFAYNHCARRIRQRDLEGLSLASMRMFINCSEPVYDASHTLFLERFSPLGLVPEMLAVSYAMAENTFAVTQTKPGTPPRRDSISRIELETKREAIPIPEDHPDAVIKISCGLSIKNTLFRIVDKHLNTKPSRHIGDILIKSDCMLDSYYRRDDLQQFRDGWYLTGDTGYVADDELYVIGRVKDLIINAGKNIYPQDIEALVNTIPGIHAGRVVAFGVPDEREGTELIVIIAEVNTTDSVERKHLTQLIRQTVSQGGGVTATYVHLVDSRWLIKTSSGKIARSANRDKWISEQAGNHPSGVG